MNTQLKKLLQITALLLVGIIFLSSCTDPIDTENQIDLDDGSRIHGLSFLETLDDHIPYIINDIDGNEAHFVAEGDVISELVIKDQSTSKLSVMFDDLQRPVQIVDGETVILFENYSDGNVDIAYIDGSENIHIENQVYVGFSDIQIRGLDDIEKVLGIMENLDEAINVAMGVVECFSVPSNPLAVVNCGSNILKFTGRMYDLARDRDLIDQNETFEWLRESASSFYSIYDDAETFAGCLSNPNLLERPYQCASLVISGAEYVVSELNNFIDKASDLIELAKGSLNSGTGEIKITLTWDNTSDLDLHVLDPNGDEIYYECPSSQSGGFLDVDDVDGFGPENIYWDYAVQGRYVVAINHYSGGSTANYRLRIANGSYVKTYSGSIAPNQLTTVKDFVFNQPFLKGSNSEKKIASFTTDKVK